MPLFGPEPYAAPARLFELAELGRERRYRNEAAIRALCHAVHLGGDRVLCRVLGRYKMFVDANDIGLSTHLMLEGYWEMWLTEALAETVRPGMTVVDVGANLGYFSMLMADLVGPAGRVHAFEPNPAMATRIAQGATVNGFHARLAVHAAALSDAPGEVALLVPPGEPKNAVIAPVAGDDAPGPVVPVSRFDADPALLDADIVKIDADTSERAIWRGMAGLFARGRPLTVFLEFTPARYDDPAAFLDEIEREGFALAWLTYDDGVQPTDRAAILAAPPADDLTLVLSR